jgi:hypothetical protein
LASVLLALVAVVAMAIALESKPSHTRLPAGHTQPAPPLVKTMPVAFRTTEGGDIVATVTDPFAAQSALNAAFTAAGLDITVTLVPVSPSLVGTVIATSGGSVPGGPPNTPGIEIQTIQRGTCIIPANGCPIGVVVPRNYTGAGYITLGRPAQPGETYESANSAFAPGESLHCSNVLNEQVATAVAQIQANSITAEWWHNSAPTNTFTNQTPPAGSDYIVGAVPISPGVVLFQTRSTALSASDIANDQYNHGC